MLQERLEAAVNGEAVLASLLPIMRDGLSRFPLPPNSWEGGVGGILQMYYTCLDILFWVGFATGCCV